MKLTTLTDYALRTLMVVAKAGRRVTAAEVASLFGISEDHVVKAVGVLGRAGLVSNVRGRGGGIDPAVPFDRITVADVVLACEGPVRLLDCSVADGTCVIEGGCKLRGVLRDAAARLVDHLRSVTIADVVRDSPALVVPALPGAPAGDGAGAGSMQQTPGSGPIALPVALPVEGGSR